MPENKKILMVDDDAEDRMLMQEVFVEIGAPAVASYADNGETALHYLENLSYNELPSVVVLDLNMPKLKGTQVLEKIKSNEKLKDIKVIIFSTSVNNIEVEQSFKLGAYACVAKPNSYDECLEKAKYFNSLSLTEEEKN